MSKFDTYGMQHSPFGKATGIACVKFRAILLGWCFHVNQTGNVIITLSGICAIFTATTESSIVRGDWKKPVRRPSARRNVIDRPFVSTTDQKPAVHHPESEASACSRVPKPECNSCFAFPWTVWWILCFISIPLWKNLQDKDLFRQRRT